MNLGDATKIAILVMIINSAIRADVRLVKGYRDIQGRLQIRSNRKSFVNQCARAENIRVLWCMGEGKGVLARGEDG
jgi:hypothetical protein